LVNGPGVDDRLRGLLAAEDDQKVAQTGGDMNVLIVEHAMSDAICRRIQAAMDVGVGEPAEVIEDALALLEDVRRASHIEVPPAILDLIDSHLDAHRNAVARFFRWTLEGREGVNVLRYEPGGFYKPHVDRAEMPAWPPAARRRVTVVLFLDSSREADPSGGFTGGVLRLFVAGQDKPVEIVPKRGMLVAFPAATVHEVSPVTGGHRDTVVDWFS
jgi:predicted 2-oxoglutarate/Fe(II)-dependent dioxygenase YbiX